MHKSLREWLFRENTGLYSLELLLTSYDKKLPTDTTSAEMISVGSLLLVALHFAFSSETGSFFSRTGPGVSPLQARAHSPTQHLKWLFVRYRVHVMFLHGLHTNIAHKAPLCRPLLCPPCFSPQARAALSYGVHGVMIGRAAYHM